MKKKIIYRVNLRAFYFALHIDCDSAGYLDNVVNTFSKMWFEKDGEKARPDISIDVIVVPENDGKDGGKDSAKKDPAKGDSEIVGAVIRGIVIDG